jgi:hypothetical protein
MIISSSSKVSGTARALDCEHSIAIVDGDSSLVAVAIPWFI